MEGSSQRNLTTNLSSSFQRVTKTFAKNISHTSLIKKFIFICTKILIAYNVTRILFAIFTVNNGSILYKAWQFHFTKMRTCTSVVRVASFKTMICLTYSCYLQSNLPLYFPLPSDCENTSNVCNLQFITTQNGVKSLVRMRSC